MQALHKLLFFHALTCLGRDAHGGEIIHGEKAPVNSMLYMASLQNNRGHHVCGGFLVSEDFVVTAAHCDGDFAQVVLGTHNLKNADKIVRTIKQKCKLPSYHNFNQGNDLMLLQLSDEVPLGERVQLIEIPDSTKSIRENEMCLVAGWGFTATGNGSVDELRVADVSVINQQVCKKEWPGLPADVICAGGFGTKKGFCQGDSGGPLVCNRKAVGVVSFNKGGNCDYPNVPNVYTDISKFLLWIKKILKQKDCTM